MSVTVCIFVKNLNFQSKYFLNALEVAIGGKTRVTIASNDTVNKSAVDFDNLKKNCFLLGKDVAI